MIDVNGIEVRIGDVIKVLVIRENIRQILADDEKPHILAMLGKNYVIDAFVNDDSQVSVSICIQQENGSMYGGLYLFPHEFRLIVRK